jgi:AcrR family transcriptional regulator
MTTDPAHPATARHRRVLQAACTLFLKNGYRVSMNSVAHEAGVSKQTVYAHFANKEALFEAAIGELMHPLHASLAPSRRDLSGTLLALARAHQAFALDPERIALGRMLMAEAPRFPQAARMLFRLTMGELQRRLTTRMAEAMEHGELRRDDPATAAEMFLSMLNGLEGDRRLFGVPGRSRKAQDLWACHAVELFLHAYAPTGPGPGVPNNPDQASMESP